MHTVEQHTGTYNVVTIERLQGCPWDTVWCIEDASCLLTVGFGVGLIRYAHTCMVVRKVVLFGCNTGYGKLLWETIDGASCP